MVIHGENFGRSAVEPESHMSVLCCLYGKWSSFRTSAVSCLKDREVVEGIARLLVPGLLCSKLAELG